jgi:hypothetical protein
VTFGVLRLAYPQLRGWPLLIAAAGWGLGAIYEWWFTTIYDPRHKFNIRADLLILVFWLIVTTLVCAIWSLRRR